MIGNLYLYVYASDSTQIRMLVWIRRMRGSVASVRGIELLHSSWKGFPHMFSAILMVAMTTGVQAPEFFFKNKAESCGTPVVVSSCTGCCGGEVVSGGCCGGREGLKARLHDRKGCCGGEVVSGGCCGGREGLMSRLHDRKASGCCGGEAAGCCGGEAGGRLRHHHKASGCCGGEVIGSGCCGGEAGGRRLGHHRTHGCCGG